MRLTSPASISVGVTAQHPSNDERFKLLDATLKRYQDEQDTLIGFSARAVWLLRE